MPSDEAQFDASGKVALITGAASGIGLACARRLVSEGAKVVIFDIQKDAGQRAADEMAATFIHGDASSSSDIGNALRRVQDELGALDIVHLNAGIYKGDFGIDDLADDDYHRIVAVNVDGVVFGVREATKLMAGKGGYILATASLSGVYPYRLNPLYSLTKHAVVGLVRSLAETLAERQIFLNALCPPVVDTEMADPYKEQLGGGLDDLLISADDVAEAMMRVFASGKSGEAWFVGRRGDTRPIRFRSMSIGMGLAATREG